MSADSLISIVAPLEGDSPDAVEAFVEETVAVLRGLVTHHEIILVDDGAPEATVARVRALLERHDFRPLPPAVAPLRRGDGDHRRARRGDRRLRHRDAAEHGSAVAHSRIPRAGARRGGRRVRRATPPKERAILVSCRRARLLLVHQRRGQARHSAGLDAVPVHEPTSGERDHADSRAGSVPANADVVHRLPKTAVSLLADQPLRRADRPSQR